jgi:hypothetical protein
MKFKNKLAVAVIILITSNSIFAQNDPYNPKPGMDKLKNENVSGKAIKKMHFLVFGDAKHSPRLADVLKSADGLNPQFCLTTADLVNKGAGEQGVKEYKQLDGEAGWFFRKYPTWPTLGNHEISGIPKSDYESGQRNFADFFGMTDPTYSFTYGNAKFIALDWPKVSEDPEKQAWLEKELIEAQGKHIFIFRHRPFYTVGAKSYNDVEGKNTVTTELFSKYNVTAVFSGHDHLYYRTKREGVHYVISAGAGARIYHLKREKDAIEGDAYYGREFVEGERVEKFRFHSSKGKEETFEEPVYFVVSVKINGSKVTMEMIDTDGKVWDKYSFKSDI